MNKTAVAAVAVIVSFGVSLAGGQVAGASQKKSCPKEALCLWTKANYTGKKLVIKDKGKTNLPPAFDNRVSSVKSRYTGGANGLAFLFDKPNANEDGDFRCFGQSFKRSPDLSDPNTAFDNVGSSVLLPKNAGPFCV